MRLSGGGEAVYPSYNSIGTALYFTFMTLE